MSEFKIRSEKARVEKDKSKLPDKITVPISYPDARYIKTNTACPSLKNVIHAKEWVEFDRL